MYRVQKNQIRGQDGTPTLQSLARRIDFLGEILTGCGPLQHDVGSTGSFELYGNSGANAGKSDWKATLDVWQQNSRAGGTVQPKLLAARFRGPVKFDNPIFGVMRSATATANWVSSTNKVAATDDETGQAIADTAGTTGVHLFVNTAGKQPNIRSGAKFWYFYDLDGTPRALSEDDAIGSVRYVSSTSIIPGGWQVADGTNSTVNLVGRYPLGHATVAGTTSGSGTTASGTAVISMSGALANESSHTHAATGLTATTPDHSHSNGTLAAASNTFDLTGVSTQTDGTHWHLCSTTSMTSATVDDDGGAINNDVVDFVNFNTEIDGAHSHAISLTAVGSHSHSITGSTATQALTITMGGNTAQGSAHTHGLGTLAATDSGHTHTYTPLSCTVIPIQRVS